MSTRSQSEFNSSGGPLANAPTSFTVFKKFPPEIRWMVWKEAAQEEMKNRVVPFGESDQAGTLVLLPTPALSSPLLKACKDSRAAFLPLVPTVLEVVGCRKSGCHGYGCNCARPSGTLYIDPDVDIAIIFYFGGPSYWFHSDGILPGFCGHNGAMLQKDVKQYFQRSITTTWGFDECVPRRESFLHNLVAQDATLYQRNSSSHKFVNYDKFLCNEAEPETAEEQAIEKTIKRGGYMPAYTPAFGPFRLLDVHGSLQTMSGPRFFQLYRNLFRWETWWVVCWKELLVEMRQRRMRSEMELRREMETDWDWDEEEEEDDDDDNDE